MSERHDLPRHARLFELIRQHGLMERDPAPQPVETSDVLVLSPEFLVRFQSRAHRSLGMAEPDRRLSDQMRGAA